jgi:hypothetical protein
MLSQLEFKLSVEKQYKDGIEKMVRLYQMEGDRKSKQDAEAKRVESNQKIQLLKHSLKRYEDLHVDIEGDGGDGEFRLPGNLWVDTLTFSRRQPEHSQSKETIEWAPFLAHSRSCRCRPRRHRSI